jgi:hypothetical protein
MSNSSFQKLFNRRPATATVGLSIAAISFIATILQGIISLLSSTNRFFFDFISGGDLNGGGGITLKQAAIGCTWALVGLIACFRSLEPRNLARFTVIATSGVKLFAAISYSGQIGLSHWLYGVILSMAAAPIVLLLTPASNAYYGRNQ